VQRGKQKWARQENRNKTPDDGKDRGMTVFDWAKRKSKGIGGTAVWIGVILGGGVGSVVLVGGWQMPGQMEQQGRIGSVGAMMIFIVHMRG
jgi:hypothetical protein